MLSHGADNTEIAKMLGYTSKRALEDFIGTHVYKHFHLSNNLTAYNKRTAAVAHALRKGIIE